MNQVYDNNKVKITGLFKSGDALVVKDDVALKRAQSEKEKMLKMASIEQTLETVVGDLAAIKTLLEKLVRE